MKHNFRVENEIKDFISLDSLRYASNAFVETFLLQVSSNPEKYPHINEATFEAVLNDSLKSKYGNMLKYNKDEGIQVDVTSESFSPYLNKDRIIKVGNDLYQFTYNFLKVIKGGEYSKVSLLENTLETDSSNGIFVYPMERNMDNDSSGNAKNARMQEGDFAQTLSAIKDVGDKRLVMYEEYIRYYVPEYGYQRTDYHIKLRSLKKTCYLFGLTCTYLDHNIRDWSGSATLRGNFLLLAIIK